MISFVSFFVLSCIGGHCESSPPIFDQAAADERLQTEQLKWFTGRAGLWAVECRQIEWAPYPFLDAFFRVSSPPAKAVGCEREFVTGGNQ